jgi:hypothetical protein
MSPSQIANEYELTEAQVREALSFYAVNNIVRVSVKHNSGYSEGIYVQITAVDGSDLIGIVQDTYRQFFEGETIYVENGESIRFSRASIIEVPLNWDGNENLKYPANS